MAMLVHVHVHVHVTCGAVSHLWPVGSRVRLVACGEPCGLWPVGPCSFCTRVARRLAISQRSHRHPRGQPCAGGLGRQDYRQGGDALSGPRALLRRRGGASP
eukprot:2094671-Prymnesium_polylepis.1